MNVLQINTAVNTGSTGRIAENIGLAVISNGSKSTIAYGRESRKSTSQTIQIGTPLDYKLHGLKTRFFDKHGFGSTAATKKFIVEIKKLKPDVIHLHNLHGYYINVEILFNYLKTTNIPVVWTLHDCWPFTGHCSYFSFVKCDKWKTQCHHCPLTKCYPESFFIDNSFSNYNIKNGLFNGLKNMMLVTPSHWMRNLLKDSFLKNYPAQVIHNGVDLQKFIPLRIDEATYREKIGAGDKNIILGVASVWDRRKGLADFKLLAALLSQEDIIVLVGVSQEIIKDLPGNIIGIPRTENIDELVVLYNMATAFINPTWVDNFPTTNIEALACGTPVITYRTGGSIEAIDEAIGFVVEQGNIEGLMNAVKEIKLKGKIHYSKDCRQRAEMFFKDEDRFNDYYRLYEKMVQKESTKMVQAR